MHKLTYNERKNLIIIINFYLETHSGTCTVADIQSYAKTKHDDEYPNHIVRDVMINYANLSYKKIISRSISYNYDILGVTRYLFAVKFV